MQFLRYFFIAFFIALACCMQAQNGLTSNTGARGLAMGNASLTFQHINSILSNQAGLSFIKTPSAILFTEQRFAVTEIRSIAAGFAYPTKSGVFGLNLNYFGFEDYNEQKIGLAYSRKLMDKLSIGAQVNYINFRIPEYGSQGFLSFDLGLQAQVLDDLILAAHIANPIGQEIVEDDNLPTVFKIGAAYCPSKKAVIMLEMEKDIDFETRIKGGLEYKLIEAFSLRAGFSSNPSAFSFGAGYTIKEQLRIDIGASYHNILGFSPGLGVIYELKSKRKK